jgi:glycosyltransferase involved in cell wall biosynthesis
VARVLLEEGWTVSLAAESFEEKTDTLGTQVRERVLLPGFFKGALTGFFPRLRDIARLTYFLWRRRVGLIFVQGDLPRLTYLVYQIFVPLIFCRQDGILTCPASSRFLPRSRTVCRKPVGFSCLAVHRRQRCFGDVSLPRRVGRIFFRLRDHILLGQMRHFLANSDYILAAHRRPGRVIYPGPAENGALRETPPREINRLAFCGRLETVKGAEEAVRILALLPAPYRLDILGDGTDRGPLENLARDLGISDRVAFHGWVAPGERDRVLASCGALLLPSLWDEAFGMAGIEAFQQGTPVVAYDVGGISEWCLPGAGILVPCGDLEAAAAAVQVVTGKAERWSLFSETARLAVQKDFTFAGFYRRTVESIEVARGTAVPTGDRP